MILGKVFRVNVVEGKTVGVLVGSGKELGQDFAPAIIRPTEEDIKKYGFDKFRIHNYFAYSGNEGMNANNFKEVLEYRPATPSEVMHYRSNNAKQAILNLVIESHKGDVPLGKLYVGSWRNYESLLGIKESNTHQSKLQNKLFLLYIGEDIFPKKVYEQKTSHPDNFITLEGIDLTSFFYHGNYADKSFLENIIKNNIDKHPPILILNKPFNDTNSQTYHSNKGGRLK